MNLSVWVYILECADGKFYVGSYRGENVQTRVDEHNSGNYPGAWTHSRRPLTLQWADSFPSADQAIDFERRLKGWSRNKKIALIEQRYSDLPQLSRRGPA
ncbi:MAG: GIY-YIG nuclease family protein [Pseudomonadota bacterium]